jgi:hypothetical protein
MIRKILIASIVFAIVGFSGMANAGLTKIGTVTIAKNYLGESARGGGMPGMGGGGAPTSNEYSMIYEDDTGLVWIDYTSGSKEWPDLVAWAKSLNEAGALTYKFNDGVNVAWNGDWRLPNTVDKARKNGFDGSTTAGFNITSSEMGHLFYVSLGNVGYYNKKGEVDTNFAGLKNKGPFQNLKESIYFSGTVYSIYTNHPWHFNFYYGGQDFTSFTNSYAYPGLAVRQAKVEMKWSINK